MLFRRTMVLEVLRTFEQGENRYTCCRRTVLSGEKGTKIGYRQGGGKGGGGRGRSKLGTAGPLFAVFPTKNLILFAAPIHATILVHLQSKVTEVPYYYSAFTLQTPL